MDAQTLDALRLTLREVFASSADPAAVSRHLADLGWAEAQAEDPAATTSALFEEQGRALGRSRALAGILLAAVEPVLPPPRGIRSITLEPGRLVAGGLDGIDEVVFLSGELRVVPVKALTVTPVGGLDPGLGLLSVSGDGEPVPGAEAYRAALVAGRRALASELVGVGQAALDGAIEHVRARTQFGRPIGSFQSERHRLAESHVDLVAARELIAEAWRSGGTEEAIAAKAMAGHAADQATRTAVQVTGAMGLTWEHPLHRYVRRAGSLDALLGGHDELRTELGRAVATAGYHPVPVTA